MMVKTISMGDAHHIYEAAYMAYPKKKGSKKATGIGFKRDPKAPRTPLKTYTGLKPKSGRRAKEGPVMRKIKRILVQEYVDVTGVAAWKLQQMDVDHIAGRHAVGFKVGAMFDLRNLQLLDRKTHSEKTQGKTRADQRADHRPEVVKNQLLWAQSRIDARLGDVWDLNDLSRALEAEIYSK